MPGTCTGPLKVRKVCFVYSSARAPVTMNIVAMASAQHIVMRIRVARMWVHSLMDDIFSRSRECTLCTETRRLA